MKPGLIRRLYEADAQGITDQGLIDEVGYAILARCESIREVTEAQRGTVACPACGTRFARDRRANAPLQCPNCDWTRTWKQYQRWYKGQRIHGSRAYLAFQRFLDEFPHAKTPRDKMLAIDRVVHACHLSEGGVYPAPAASNLIEGKRDEVMTLLDSLAYGKGTTPGLREVRRRWEAEMGRDACDG